LRYNVSRFSHFYFSCKKYQETVQERITKVVVIFTRNPTKLGSHFFEFSTIFYGFSKDQQNSYTIEVTALLPSPWKELKSYKKVVALHSGPWKDSLARNWALGGVSGAARRKLARPAARRNLARPAAAVSQERAEGGLELA
jgi:hypothetical protein